MGEETKPCLSKITNNYEVDELSHHDHRHKQGGQGGERTHHGSGGTGKRKYANGNFTELYGRFDKYEYADNLHHFQAYYNFNHS